MSSFAEDLALERAIALNPEYGTPQEEEIEEDAQAEAEKKADPFDDPKPKKLQRNWLQHGLTKTVSMEKAKRGRPFGSQTKGIAKDKATREAIQIMTATGITKTAMAKILGIAPATLNTKYADEMEHGKDMLTTRIVNALIRKALDGNVTAQTFFLKTKADFREADKNEPLTSEKLALSDVERKQRMMSLLMTNPEFRVMMGEKLLESKPKPIEVKPTEYADTDVFDI